MRLVTVKIDKPQSTNVILGQTHFIKTVEDVHEVLVAVVGRRGYYANGVSRLRR